jgi:hypothetical protein
MTLETLFSQAVYDASPLVRAEVAVGLARLAEAHSVLFQVQCSTKLSYISHTSAVEVPCMRLLLHLVFKCLDIRTNGANMSASLEYETGFAIHVGFAI